MCVIFITLFRNASAVTLKGVPHHTVVNTYLFYFPPLKPYKVKNEDDGILPSFLPFSFSLICPPQKYFPFKIFFMRLTFEVGIDTREGNKPLARNC